MNDGYINEKLLLSELNYKSVREIRFPFLKEVVRTVFPDIGEEDQVVCHTVGGHQKADIVLKWNKKTCYLSIKKGESNSVHQEDVYEFCKFLLRIGISESSVKMLLFYHFGDGTLDGTGKEKMSAEMLKLKYASYLKRMNEEINQKRFLLPILSRALFCSEKERHRVDYILYGTPNYGFVISHEKLLDFLSIDYCLHLLTPHFGPLVFQPHSRNEKVDKKRRYMQLKWPSLVSDLQKAK